MEGPPMQQQDDSETVRYVEVPVVVADEVVHRPVVEYVKVDKVVPVFNYHVKEKFVDSVQLETVNTEVDLVQSEDVVRSVSKRTIVPVPTEKIVYKKKLVVKEVEQVVEVPGKMIQVPREVLTERKVIVPRYTNEEVPVVVSQIVEPSVAETDEEVIEVVLREYVPQFIPVDVFIPKPVERPVRLHSRTHLHRTTDVPPAQYNALVKAVNTGATDQVVDGLLVKNPDGGIPMVNAPDFVPVPPNSDDWKTNHYPRQLHVTSAPGQHFVFPEIFERNPIAAT